MSAEHIEFHVPIGFADRGRQIDREFQDGLQSAIDREADGMRNYLLGLSQDMFRSDPAEPQYVRIDGEDRPGSRVAIFNLPEYRLAGTRMGIFEYLDQFKDQIAVLSENVDSPLRVIAYTNEQEKPHRTGIRLERLIPVQGRTVLSKFHMHSKSITASEEDRNNAQVVVLSQNEVGTILNQESDALIDLGMFYWDRMQNSERGLLVDQYTNLHSIAKIELQSRRIT